MDTYWLLYWDLTQRFGRLKIETYKYRNIVEKLLDMTLFQNNAPNLNINVFWWIHGREPNM